MAREVQVRIADDLDRAQDAEITREIGFNGFVYLLDLTNEHDKELTSDLDKWLKASHRRVKWPKRQIRELLKEVDPITPPNGTEQGADTRTGANNATIRKWARDNGYEVSNRGYLPRRIEDAYHEATGGKKRGK